MCLTHIIELALDVYARRIYLRWMDNPRIANVIGALALALSDRLLREAQDQAPEPGPAAAAIALLRHEPGLTIERLRRALGLSHPGAVRLVDRLCEDGLVFRGMSARDRRAVALHLTDKGEAACSAILLARQGGLAPALSHLNAVELATFGALAEKILRGVVENQDHAYAICRLCDCVACSDCPVDDELQGRAAKAV